VSIFRRNGLLRKFAGAKSVCKFSPTLQKPRIRGVKDGKVQRTRALQSRFSFGAKGGQEHRKSQTKRRQARRGETRRNVGQQDSIQGTVWWKSFKDLMESADCQHLGKRTANSMRKKRHDHWPEKKNLRSFQKKCGQRERKNNGSCREKKGLLEKKGGETQAATKAHQKAGNQCELESS